MRIGLTFKRIFFTPLIVIFASILLFSFFTNFDVSAANVLTNGSFTGGTTGWTLTGAIEYSARYVDSPGSLKGSSLGRKTTTTGYATQTISSTITGGSSVILAVETYKQCVSVACEFNELHIQISYEGGAYQTIWSDTSNPAPAILGPWYSLDKSYDVSSYFTATGSYTIRIFSNMRTGNNALAEANGWIDKINLDVTPPTVTLSTTGTQVSTLLQGATNAYVGGAITLVRNLGSTSTSNILLQNLSTLETANITQITLYYKEETVCSTSIPADATVFGSATQPFIPNRYLFSGSMNISTSQTCMYVEVDIGPGANIGDILDFYIEIPSVAQGIISPTTANISGTTTIVAGNTAPSFTNFTENGPVNPGSAVTFTATASDSNGDNVYLVVCKTDGVTGNACDGGAGDTWCTSSSVAFNPSCQYTTPSVYPDGIYNVYPYVFDANNLGSTDPYQGAEFSFTVNNVAPVVSAVTINGGTAISLEAGTRKTVTLTATVTDNNSCQDLSSVLGYVYRSGITYTGCDSLGEANNNNCYPEVSCTVSGATCTDNTDASADYTCTVDFWYYADPTDDNTQYPTEFWMTTIEAIDNNSATNATEVSAGVKLNSLTAFNITTSVNYGTLGAGEKNDPLDKVTIITPKGNVGLDNEVYGPANMCTDFPTCSGATIAIGYQKYALSSSTAYSSASSLSTTATEVETNVAKVTNGIPTTKSIWWGMLVPEGTSPGTYDGNINVNGIKGEVLDW